MPNNPFNPKLWIDLTPKFKFKDITYHISKESTALRIAINRPDCRNAFRPQTVDELIRAFDDSRTHTSIGCVILTGNGPSTKDGGWAFSSGEINVLGKKMDILMKGVQMMLQLHLKTSYFRSSTSN